MDIFKPSGLLQALSIHVKPWVDINMDFVEGLPKSLGYEVIFVVVDRLTKYVHFLTLSHAYTATKLGNVFMKEVFRLHGMLASIVSVKSIILGWQP